MSAEGSAGLVRRWVAFYTRGLPAPIRQDRRDEIEDDLWCQMDEAARTGRTDRSLAGELVMRLVFGVPADVSWRAEQLRLTTIRQPAGSFGMRGRFVARLAIFGGAGWVIWPIPQALYGEAAWTISPVSWLLMVTLVFGTLALAGATAGLVLGFQDTIRGGVAVLGSLGASIGALSVMGFYIGVVALFVGSAVVVWELGRVGVLDRWVSRAHVAAAIIALVSIVSVVAILANTISLSAIAAILLLGLLMSYGFSWIAIGWSLRHGASMPAGGAAGA